MRGKMVFLAGLGIGYVLGSRAGRERYEQLVRVGRKLRDNPTLQEVAGVARAQAERAVEGGRGFLADKLGDTSFGHTRMGGRFLGIDEEHGPGSRHQKTSEFPEMPEMPSTKTPGVSHPESTTGRH